MGFEIGRLVRLPLGYVGEHESRVISIDMNEWLGKWPNATIVVQVVRPDGYKYFAATELESGVMTWEVTAGETLYEGKGFAQITAVDLDTNKEYKSRVVETIIAESLEEFNSLVLAETDPAQKWVNKVLEAAQNASKSAESAEGSAESAKESAEKAVAAAENAEKAVDKMPIIGDNGNWWVWDAESETFVDSGAKADGLNNLIDGAASNSVRQISAAAEDDTYTIGVGAIALGLGCRASGNNSRTGGAMSTAAGHGAVAEGLACEANGAFSRAHGGASIADGEYSVVMGEQTYAHGKDQLVIGRQNIHDTTGDKAFIVGNGDEEISGEECRSNAFSVDWNGNGWFQGNVFVEGNANGSGEVLAKRSEAAPVIIPTVTGEVITVSDSANRPLAGLTLYGRTTQEGTPTPSAPVPLVNAGLNSPVTVTATGKNLLPDTEVTNQFPGGTGNVYTAATTSGVAVIGTVRLLAGVTYTLSATRVSGSGSLPCLILRAADGTNFESNYGHTAVPVTYIPSADVDATVLIQGNGGNTATTIGDSYAVQLEIGSAATAFEPYKDGYSASFSTPNGLPGIPVSTGGNYTDENGQQWLCDEIIWPEMRYVQRVGKYTFTGNEAAQIYGNMNSLGYIRYQILMLGAEAAYVSHDNAVPSLCTQYTPIGATDLAYLINNDKAGYYSTFITAGQMVFSTNAATLDAFRTEIAGTTVMYQLAEPIETTPELVIYQSLASKYPHTTILNDGGAGMKASYVADTKNYIDQRIAAIAAAMINA